MMGQVPPRQTPDWFRGPRAGEGGDLSRVKGWMEWRGEELDMDLLDMDMLFLF